MDAPTISVVGRRFHAHGNVNHIYANMQVHRLCFGARTRPSIPLPSCLIGPSRSLVAISSLAVVVANRSGMVCLINDYYILTLLCFHNQLPRQQIIMDHGPPQMGGPWRHARVFGSVALVRPTPQGPADVWVYVRLARKSMGSRLGFCSTAMKQCRFVLARRFRMSRGVEGFSASLRSAPARMSRSAGSVRTLK